MNKAQLIDALAERLGDRKVAAAAVAALVDVVVRTVNDGERVTITGFGVFEKRARAARTARNPRTGQTVPVRQTDVPAFRPGTLFREVVSGTRVLPDAGASSSQSTGPAPVETGASASSPPATRVTAATRLTAAHVNPATVTKTTKVTKAPKSAMPMKAAKVAKVEPKATKGNAKGPDKATGKKAGKKSASKK
ncbi:MAG: HU family DNA-binding protein [Pseudonocardiaceae bacterium]